METRLKSTGGKIRLLIFRGLLAEASYPGTDIHTQEYIENTDIAGRMDQQFADAMAFVLRHLRREQGDQGINSLGKPEIPRVVIEELLANALMHRDYFISAPIRIFLFDDRIEIVSPGHLPNIATRIVPYRGLGTGIVRALREYPRIELTDDRERNKFRED